ncbi:hypothetical protein TNCV_764601 [Trichonephila clavipes]|nr:hypothetical protein TNCV_764601 [Trichonephila clavipes]
MADRARFTLISTATSPAIHACILSIQSHWDSEVWKTKAEMGRLSGIRLRDYKRGNLENTKCDYAQVISVCIRLQTEVAPQSEILQSVSAFLMKFGRGQPPKQDSDADVCAEELGFESFEEDIDI